MWLLSEYRSKKKEKGKKAGTKKDDCNKIEKSKKNKEVALVFLDPDERNKDETRFKKSCLGIVPFAVKEEKVNVSLQLHIGLRTIQNSIRDIANSEMILGGEKANAFLKKNEDLGNVITCVSMTSGNPDNSFAFCEEAKERGATTVIGGPHASLFYENILSNRSYIDFVVVGNGEDAIKELFLGKSVEKIHNLAWRYGESNKIMFNGANGSVVEKWSKTMMVRIPQDVSDDGVSAVVSHLGCQWRDRTGGCSFCSTESIPYCRKDPTLFWEEISQLRKFGAKKVYDRSDYLTKAHMKELSQTKPSSLGNFKINVFTRVGDVDNAFIEHSKSIGVNEIFLGVESGDQRILNHMKKGISVEQSMKATVILLHEGFKPTIGLVIGSLGESRESVKKTIDLGLWFKEIGVENVFTAVFIPTPGSSAFNILQEKGLVDEKSDVFNLELLSSLWIKKFTSIDDDDIKKALSVLNG